MKKGKLGGNSKWLALGVVGLLIVGGLYAVSNSTGNLADNNKQVGAVAASVSGVVKGAVSASASSPQPVITVTAWPSFEMKFDNTGNENNLVVKADYSVTAKGGKIYTPAGWALMNVRNTLDQGAGAATKVEVTALDVVATTNCYWGGVMWACYVIPDGKTVRFTAKQTYNPKVMFGGVYSAKLTDFYFLPVTNGQLYYQPFPAQTSRLNTITVVGEKSPYLYTTAVEVAQNSQTFVVKGVRLTGAKPIMEGATTTVISQSSDSATIKSYALPGVYRLYFSHPTYGNSNSAWVTVKAASSTSSILTTIANRPATPKSQNIKVSPNDGVQKLTMQVFDVKSTIGDSVVTDVSVNAYSKGNALPSMLFLYDGSYLLASVAGPTTSGGMATFKNLGIKVIKDQIKSLTIKATFPSTVINSSLATTGITTTDSILYRTPDSQTKSGGPISPIYSNDQYFYAAAPQWTLIGSSNTLNAGIQGVVPSSLTGKITLKVHGDGGSLTKPTASDFSVVFASSTQSDPSSYAAANSISVTPTVVVSPTDATVGDGGDYVVEITGVLYSSNTSFGASQTLFMAIKDIDTSIGGITITNQTWGINDFFTSAQYLTKGTL
ncbi:MAG: hypothetical protein Q7T49_00825 [bacterium]|nr:hypothetical protein [bacterium]